MLNISQKKHVKPALTLNFKALLRQYNVASNLPCFCSSTAFATLPVVN